LQEHGVEIRVRINDRAPTIVSFKGVKKGFDLPDNVAYLLAVAAWSHMLGINYRR
jgi:hypothetical protein